MKYFLFFIIVLSSQAFAQYIPVPDNVSMQGTNFKAYNPLEGHWIANFGFESIKYELPFQYTGVKESFEPSEQELFGGRLGIGREFYLGKGFMTTTRVEGFYVGTLFAKYKTAAPDVENVRFASSKKTGQILGIEASQSLSHIFNMKTKNPFMEEWTYLTVEPFIEGTLGIAQAFHKLNYTYDTVQGGVAGDTVDESYRHRVGDNLLSTRLSLGVIFTSNSGFFLSLKATQTAWNVTKRKEDGFRKENGGSEVRFSESPNNVDMDTVTSYAVGGGYKW